VLGLLEIGSILEFFGLGGKSQNKVFFNKLSLSKRKEHKLTFDESST
jgi:hypothetical protein